MKLGIVVSTWYWEDITSKMLDLAVKKAKEHGIETEIVKVPGSHDITLGVKRLLKKKEIDGVVTLGAVVQGKTYHDVVIMHALAKTLQELSLEFEKPVMLGVNGPRMTLEQAIERIQRAEDVMEACIKWLK